MFFIVENKSELVRGEIRIRGIRVADAPVARDICLGYFDRDYLSRLEEKEKDKLAMNVLRRTRMVFVERGGAAIGVFEIGDNKSLKYDAKRYAKRYCTLGYRKLGDSEAAFGSVLEGLKEYIREFRKPGYNYFFEIDEATSWMVGDLERSGFEKDRKDELSKPAMEKLDRMLSGYGLENSYRKNDIYILTI